MLLHLGTRKGYLAFRRAARGDWRVARSAFVGDPVSQLLPDPRDGRIYAAMDLGHFGVKLRVSEDDGASFTELPSPALPAGEPGDKKAPSVKMLWCLEAAGPEPGTLWCGVMPGALFRSDDGGASWELNRNLWEQPLRSQWFGGGFPHSGIHSVLVSPDGRRVVCGVSCGGVWVSDDGGETFAVRTEGMFADYMPPEGRHDPGIQDPHRLAWCESDRNRIWCQHHNAFFRSDDGAETWTSLDVPPSSFGFAVAAHPEDRDTAWSVPLVKDECRVPVDQRMVVARTRDGGGAWETLGRGLPDANSFAVVFRHGLAVHADGDTLALATTTGGLWISENQGDSWDLITHQLPPVYAVRWNPVSRG